MIQCVSTFLFGALLSTGADGRRAEFDLGGGATARQRRAHELYEARGAALSVQEAEEAFGAWRAHLEERAAGGSNTSSSTEDLRAEAAELSAGGAADGVPPGRLAKALVAATMPTPAMAACMNMRIDLTSLGAPGVILAIGLRGEISYTLCSQCFEWRIEAELAFEWGVSVLGKGLSIGFFVGGSVNLRELPCSEAPESSYCRFLHVLLPPEEKMLVVANKRCHSDTPFDTLTAFVNYQWRRLEGLAHKDRKHYASALDQQLGDFEDGLLGYVPILEREPPAEEPPAEESDERILVVECLGATGLREADLKGSDPFCELEVAPAEASADDNYQRYWGGEGPRTAGECKYNWNTFDCDNKDRCMYYPDLLTGEHCHISTKFMGELWRSSYSLGTVEPAWGEGHGFRLPAGTTSVKLRAAVYDFDLVGGSELLGAALAEGVELGESPVTLSLDLKTMFGYAGGVLQLQLRWLPREAPGEPVGALAPSLGAASAALESFVGKLPDYADQVEGRITDEDDDSGADAAGIKYEELSGRYLARWRRAEVRSGMEAAEVADVVRTRHAVGAAGAHGEDEDAPEDDSGCSYNETSRQCEPRYYCRTKKERGLFGLARKSCGLKKIAGEACKKDLKDEFCCGSANEDGTCKDGVRTQCQVAEHAPRLGHTPTMVCSAQGFHSHCECAPGLCYSAKRRKCLLPEYDCTRGTRKQRDSCRQQRAKDRLQAWRAQIPPDSPIQRSFDQQMDYAFSASLAVPCTSTPATSDERVLNFARALGATRKEGGSGGAPAAREAFLAEVITSMANLFVRTTADVQAMFNVYFANDPHWDDDCLTLEPAFQNFFEYDSRPASIDLQTQPLASEDHITRRVAEGGTVSGKGPRMSDKENPWCWHTWSSGSRLQSERIDFLYRDPPTGKSGHRTPARELGGTMRPQLWCALASELRSSQEGQQRPFGEAKFRRGWTVAFQAACSQLHYISEEGGDGEFTIWRRYDCERTVLGSNFLTLFPSFALKVQEHRRKFGALLEDALQCAGRIEHREFPSEDDFVREHCVVLASEMAKRRTEDGSARAAFLEASARRAMDMLSDWLAELGRMAGSMVKDFNEAMGFGKRLTGLAYRSGGGIGEVRDVLGSKEAIEERIKRVHEHLVTKAWRARGQSDRALFPPPVKYEATTEVGVHVSTKARDLCRVELPPGLEAKLQSMHAGETHTPTFVSSSKSCAVGSFAPVPSVEIALRGCSHTVEVDGEMQPETSWSISLRSILHVKDLAKKTKTSLAKALSHAAPLDRGALREDRAMQSLAWNLAKAVLRNPRAVLNAGTNATAAAKPLVAPVAMELKKLAMAAASKGASDLSRDAAKGIFGLGADLKVYRLLHVDLQFVKTGEAPAQPTLAARYITTTGADVSIGFPGALSIATHVQLSQSYDLSLLISTIYHHVAGRRSAAAFDACVACLDKPHSVFCFDRASEGGDCVPAADVPTAPLCQAGELEDPAIYDVTDCDRVEEEAVE